MPRVDSPHSLPDWFISWPSFEVDWRRTALLVIDYQNYSSNPSAGVAKMLLEQRPDVAAYYIPRITKVTIPNSSRLIDGFRRAAGEVIYTRHGSLLAGGRDMVLRRRRRETDVLQMTGVPHMAAVGSFEHAIIDPLAPQPGELVIDKNSASPFNSTGIDQLLHNMRIETLVISGMATEMCVETTARDAADRGYNVIVVEDAVATFCEEHHYAALSALARVFTQVWNTDEVLAALHAAAQPSQ
jgi:biuret amidohydrolase